MGVVARRLLSRTTVVVALAVLILSLWPAALADTSAAAATKAPRASGVVAAALKLPKGFTTFRHPEQLKAGEVLRDRCGKYTIVRTGVRLAGSSDVLTRVTVRNAAGKVVFDHGPSGVTSWQNLDWCGDLLRDGSRVLELTLDSGDIWTDTRLLWLGSNAIEILHLENDLIPVVLASSGPYGLQGYDFALAALSSTPDAQDPEHGRDIIPVSSTGPLPRLFVWREARYVDDTRHQTKILRSWRSDQIRRLGPPSVPDSMFPNLAPARCGSLLAIAIESLWLGDWNTIGPALGMNTPEKQALARLLPVAFERLGMVVGDDVPSDAYLVDPSTIPAGGVRAGSRRAGAIDSLEEGGCQ